MRAEAQSYLSVIYCYLSPLTNFNRDPCPDTMFHGRFPVINRMFHGILTRSWVKLFQAKHYLVPISQYFGNVSRETYLSNTHNYIEPLSQHPKHIAAALKQRHNIIFDCKNRRLRSVGNIYLLKYIRDMVLYRPLTDI